MITKERALNKLTDSVLYMFRFKLWTGIGRGNTTISPEDLERERNQNYRTLETQIDHFPDQIDR